MPGWQWFVEVWFVWVVLVLSWQLKVVVGHLLDCYFITNDQKNWHNWNNPDVAEPNQKKSFSVNNTPFLAGFFLPIKKLFVKPIRLLHVVFCAFIFILPALPTLTNALYAPSIDSLVIKQLFKRGQNWPNMNEEYQEIFYCAIWFLMSELWKCNVQYQSWRSEILIRLNVIWFSWK